MQKAEDVARDVKRFMSGRTRWVMADVSDDKHDGSDDKVESHQQCSLLQASPNDIIETMLDNHGEHSAEKGAIEEGTDPTCQSVQENPCAEGQSSQTEVVCTQLKPMPQEFRKAMVTGQGVNRERLTLTLCSNIGTVCMSVVCQGEDGDKDSDDEDSKDRKRKAMDRLVSEWQL